MMIVSWEKKRSGRKFAQFWIVLSFQEIKKFELIGLCKNLSGQQYITTHLSISMSYSLFYSSFVFSMIPFLFVVEFLIRKQKNISDIAIGLFFLCSLFFFFFNLRKLSLNPYRNVYITKSCSDRTLDPENWQETHKWSERRPPKRYL